MDTAREDFRDVLAVAEYPHQFRKGMLAGEPEEAEDAAAKDYEAYQAWINTDSESERFFVCEHCVGIGLVPDSGAMARSADVSHLPNWIVCPVCQGSGRLS